MFAPLEGMPDNGNVNVARLGERFVAMTETPLPVAVRPARRCEAAEVRPYVAPGQLSTAHPHMDRSNGGMINYAAKLGPRSSYRFFAVDPEADGDGRLRSRVIASLAVSEPAYMHSFGLTERHLVLVEFPLVVNPLSLATGRRPFIENYRWKPERGTRFTLIDRASGEVTGGFQAEACFAFHHVNAFERDGEVVVDICAFEDAGIIEDLYLERLRAGKPVRGATLTRFRLGVEGRTVARERLAEQELELPRINYGRCNERPYRYVWGTGVGSSGWLESRGEDRPGGRLGVELVGAGLLPGRAGVRRRPGSGGRGRGRAAVGRARRAHRSARSCSCSTPPISASWRAHRSPTTSPSASTGSSPAPERAPAKPRRRRPATSPPRRPRAAGSGGGGRTASCARRPACRQRCAAAISSGGSSLTPW